MSCKILADSTCDLSPELVSRYDITILPLHVLLGEAEHKDGVDVTPAELLAWSDEHHTTPKTSAPSIDDAKHTLAELLGDDPTKEVVCFSISSEMSSSGNVMAMAAHQLHADERVFVVDSRNLSTGIGHLIIEAAIMASEGKTGAEIEAEMNRLTGKVRTSFIVDTLLYLHRGGRCSGLAALAGAALKLHPVIVVEDGKMHATKKYRGTINMTVPKYVKDMEEALLAAKPDRVFITHSPIDASLVEEVRAYLESLHHFDEILETTAGSVISSHCGPGTLGVLFMEA